MQEELLYLLRTFVAVFVIVDPFAVVPVYLTLTDRFSPQGIAQTRKKAVIVAWGVLTTFAVTGLTVFHLFGITLPAFQIAGGILLLLLGIAQLNNNRPRVKPEETNEGMDKEDVSVFPLGTPLLAGPGAISTVVLLSTQAHGYRIIELALSVVLAMATVYIILSYAHHLFKILGRTGLNLLTRIMGLILTAIAIQFMINGLKGVLEMLGILAAPA